MSKVLIVTDSASDVSYENEEKYGIKVLPYTVILDDVAYVSRVDFDNEKFFRMMHESGNLPTTAQITSFEFVELYKEFYDDGYTDAIIILINSEGSATYRNCVQAVDMLKDEYPEVKLNIYPIDSRTYTGGYGHIAVKAAKMAQEGRDVEEILAEVHEWIDNVLIYAGLYTLKYAAKSGRIPSATAFMGDAVGLKPIMRIWDHVITTKDRVRGEKNIIPFTVQKACELMEPGSEYCVVYGEDESDRDKTVAAATEAIGYPPADIYQIGAAIAANAGPRVAGVIFKQKKNEE